MVGRRMRQCSAKGPRPGGPASGCRHAAPAMLLAAFAAVVPGACTAPDAGPATPTREELANGTYTGIFDEPITLADDRYQGPPYTGTSASYPSAMLLENTLAYGDVDGDGVDEAIVALASNTGGSGVLVYLVVVTSNAGIARNIAAEELEDRAIVRSIAVVDGNIRVDVVRHGPDDPMCCPTLYEQETWKFADGHLTRLATKQLAAARGLDARWRGHLVWGHEARSFTECDSNRDAWVRDETGGDLVATYGALAAEPYDKVFIEAVGTWQPIPVTGFGAQYPETFVVRELLRAEREGPGCRLDLNGVRYILSGNEPGWRLDVRDSDVTYTSMNEPEARQLPPATVERSDASVMITARGDDITIRATLEHRRCIDSMSGARYEFTAAVDVNGRQFGGCALRGLDSP